MALVLRTPEAVDLVSVLHFVARLLNSGESSTFAGMTVLFECIQCTVQDHWIVDNISNDEHGIFELLFQQHASFPTTTCMSTSLIALAGRLGTWWMKKRAACCTLPEEMAKTIEPHPLVMWPPSWRRPPFFSFQEGLLALIAARSIQAQKHQHVEQHRLGQLEGLENCVSCSSFSSSSTAPSS